jgi:hypothetical protein
MGNYSTDISKAENHLSPQITEHENDHDIQVLYFDRYQYVEVLKRWMGSDTSGSWIYDLSWQNRETQTIQQNLHKFAYTQIDHILSQKWITT